MASLTIADRASRTKPMAKKWIAKAIKHPGALHETLGVPKGEKIPEEKLEKAAHSGNATTRKRANLAMTLKGMSHKRSLYDHKRGE